MQYSSGTGAKCQIIRLHYRHCGSERSVAVWRGTPYRYGGMSRRGVDCSGFVVVTMRDKFDLQLPRDTREQSKIGTRIDKDELLPGDLVFFKTGSGESGLHVGIYDTNNEFIHASTSRGVMRSSLDNVYWRKKLLAGTANLTSQTI